MKSTLLKYTLILLTIISSNITKGQMPMTLYYLENVPQSSMINPAMNPRPNFFFAIPMTNFGTTFQSDMAMDDFIQFNNQDEPISLHHDAFNYSKIYNKMGNSLNFQTQQHIAPLMFGFRFKKGYFTFSMTEKISMNYGLPKSFFQLAELGLDGSYDLDLSTMSIENYMYHEFSLGYSREINDKLNVGIHIKPLFGVAASATDFQTLNIKLNETVYNMQANAHINASVPGIKEITYDEDGIPTDFEQEDIDASFIISNALSFSNPGIAFDLGAEYKFDQRWSFSASLNDLGSINWKDDLHTITMTGNHLFEGAYINASNIDSSDLITEAIIDSLLDGMQFTHEPRSFKTKLNPTLYIGAKYDVNHVFSLGFLSRSIFQKDLFRQDFNLSANLNLYKRFTTSINYNIDNFGTSSMGFGMSSFIGPLQIYLAMDKIPLSYNTYKNDGDEYPIPANFQSINFMFGMNIIFGAKGYKDKPMLSLKNK
ncbi:MAG: hypothetical protein JW717_01470 [Marinilabiliaceae bacterium]|nr:hypothetical protein [Marinilabiliaceae bacterium]